MTRVFGLRSVAWQLPGALCAAETLRRFPTVAQLVFGGLAHAASGPATPSEVDVRSAYCLSVMTLYKATLEILEYDEPDLERGRQAAVRAAETGTGRLERYLSLRSRLVDPAALSNAAAQGVTDFRLMLAAAEACSVQCAQRPGVNAREAARCSADCQAAKEPGAVARADRCRAGDWLP